MENITKKIKEVQTYFIEKILNRDFSIEAINNYADARENKSNRYVISLVIDQDKPFSFLALPQKNIIIQTQSFITLTKEALERDLSEKLLQTFNELIRANNNKKNEYITNNLQLIS